MIDSGISTHIHHIWFNAITISSPKRRTSAGDPVQHKKWAYPCYKAVSTEHQQRGRAHGVWRLPNIWQLSSSSSSSTTSSVFCPKAGPSLQAEKPRLQFYRRQVFHRKLRNQGCSFVRELISVVASRCFPYPALFLASEQTLKDLKRSKGHQRGGEESGFGYLGPPNFTEICHRG